MRSQPANCIRKELLVKKTKHFILGILFVAASSASLAQNSGVSLTEITKADVSVPGRQAIVSHVEIAPGGGLGWHTHAGDEISYVESGVLTLLVAGKPERKIEAGGGFVVPAGTVHRAKNDGTIPVQLVVVHVVDKDKPLATPVAHPTE
jgi:quercetin dioxygenase-like cupin family protein